jgi:hypothetical protein
MECSRQGAGAVLLSDGRIMVAGGKGVEHCNNFGGSDPAGVRILKSTEIFDPVCPRPPLAVACWPDRGCGRVAGGCRRFGSSTCVLTSALCRSREAGILQRRNPS